MGHGLTNADVPLLSMQFARSSSYSYDNAIAWDPNLRTRFWYNEKYSGLRAKSFQSNMNPSYNYILTQTIDVVGDGLAVRASFTNSSFMEAMGWPRDT